MWNGAWEIGNRELAMWVKGGLVGFAGSLTGWDGGLVGDEVDGMEYTELLQMERKFSVINIISVNI